MVSNISVSLLSNIHTWDKPEHISNCLPLCLHPGRVPQSPTLSHGPFTSKLDNPLFQLMGSVPHSHLCSSFPLASGFLVSTRRTVSGTVHILLTALLPTWPWPLSALPWRFGFSTPFLHYVHSCPYLFRFSPNTIVLLFIWILVKFYIICSISCLPTVSTESTACPPTVPTECFSVHSLYTDCLSAVPTDCLYTHCAHWLPVSPLCTLIAYLPTVHTDCLSTHCAHFLPVYLLCTLTVYPLCALPVYSLCTLTVLPLCTMTIYPLCTLTTCLPTVRASVLRAPAVMDYWFRLFPQGLLHFMILLKSLNSERTSFFSFIDICKTLQRVSPS